MSSSLQKLLLLVEPRRSSLEHQLQVQSIEQLRETEHIVAEALCAIRARINDTLAINRLPPEILLYIFKAITREAGYCLDPYLRPKERVSTGALLALTHVCKKWRDVALNCPTLWTCIDNHKTDQMHAFLARSRDVPVNVHLYADHLKQSAPFLARDGHRVKRLDITLRGEEFSDEHLGLHFRAPLLECFTVLGAGEGVVVPHSSIVRPLLAASCSNLQALALSNVNPGPIGFQYPRLTHLYLTHPGGVDRGRGVGRHNTYRLFDILAHTPALQHLHVGKLDHWEAEPRATNAIALPTLRSMTCSESRLEPALRLLELLELPRDALVRLEELRCTVAEDHMRAYMFPSLAFFSSFTSLEVVSNGPDVQIIAQGPNSGFWMQVRCMKLCNWTEWLSRLTAIIPISGPSITFLKVLTYDHPVISRLLAQLPVLVELSVYVDCGNFTHEDDVECVMFELYDALTPGPNPCNPQLQVLTITYYAPGEPPCYAQEFVTMAARRAAAGHPLRKVNLDFGISTDPASGICGRSEDVATFRQAQEHVLELLDIWDPPRPDTACEVDLDARWALPEAQRWWRFPDDEQASDSYNIMIPWRGW
ncbi:hypothetical protein GY45DRAFT_1325421 [Cubamyces sp. BRFM 1775]|nr:hypothetical protein GY45DRAFT_1325421 [Cubamyces sp. BRFM 1775]